MLVAAVMKTNGVGVGATGCCERIHTDSSQLQTSDKLIWRGDFRAVAGSGCRGARLSWGGKLGVHILCREDTSSDI